jgi:hypothetical protein
MKTFMTLLLVSITSFTFAQKVIEKTPRLFEGTAKKTDEGIILRWTQNKEKLIALLPADEKSGEMKMNVTYDVLFKTIESDTILSDCTVGSVLEHKLVRTTEQVIPLPQKYPSSAQAPLSNSYGYNEALMKALLQTYNNSNGTGGTFPSWP